MVTSPGGARASTGATPFSGKAGGTKANGSRFDQLVRQKTVDASIPADVLSQIAGLLQTGTPMTTIVETVAKTVADRIHDAAPHARPIAGDPSKTVLATIRSALAPPGTAPPDGPAARQVAALARRLQAILESVTGGTRTAGQTNDISGDILDAAATAKDIPARTETVRSILERSVAALRSSPGDELSIAQPSLPPAPPVVSILPTLPVAPGATASARASSDASAGPAPSRGDRPAPDLLTRMLDRAASASARAAGIAAEPRAVSSGGASDVSFARLVATIERAAPHDDAALPAPDATRTIPAALPAHDLPIAVSPRTDAPTAPAPYATVDPEAVLAQIVKGISVKAITDGVHTVQLHLQPAHLGDVSLKLSVDGSAVSASVVAQNGDVRDALLTNQHHLARAFAESGLKLSGFSVDVSGGDARGFHQEQRSQGFGRRYVVHETTDAVEGDAIVSEAAPANLELLNHLA